MSVSEPCEIVITAPDPDWLYSFARSLVEDGLAASAHSFTPGRSIYRWQGQVHERTEGRVSLQTSRDHIPDIVGRAQREHPYEVPHVTVRPIIDGNPDYLAWIARETDATSARTDDEPLIMRRNPNSGLQLHAYPKETDQVHGVVTTLSFEGTTIDCPLGSAPRSPTLSVPATRMIVTRQIIPLSLERDKTVGQHIARAEALVQEELSATASSYAVKEIGEYVFPMNQPQADQALDNACQTLHNIVIGKPVQTIASWAGAPADVHGTWQHRRPRPHRPYRCRLHKG